MPLSTPAPVPGPVETGNKFEDLSGIDTAAYENPYDALIDASHGDPVCNLSPLVYVSRPLLGSYPSTVLLAECRQIEKLNSIGTPPVPLLHPPYDAQQPTKSETPLSRVFWSYYRPDSTKASRSIY